MQVPNPESAADRSTHISTTPRPFRLARCTRTKTAPKLVEKYNVQNMVRVREQEVRVLDNGQGPVSRAEGQNCIAPMVGNRMSSVTTTTLVQNDLRLSQDSFETEGSISDTPPTYHSENGSDLSLNVHV